MGHACVHNEHNAFGTRARHASASAKTIHTRAERVEPALVPGGGRLQLIVADLVAVADRAGQTTFVEKNGRHERDPG